MAELANVYVNENLATGANDGTSEVDAYQSLQTALSAGDPGSEGVVFHCKAGTAYALPPTGYSVASLTPGVSTPVQIRGYTSTIYDGGQCEFEGTTNSATTFIAHGNKSHISIADVHINGCSGTSLNLYRHSSAVNCKVVGGTRGIVGNQDCTFVNCELSGQTSTTQAALAPGAGGHIEYCWILSDESDAASGVCIAVHAGATCMGTIVTITGGTNSRSGIKINGDMTTVTGCTIDGGTSDGSGILFSSNMNNGAVHNNIISNFSTAGGSAVDFASHTEYVGVWANNTCYNNANPIEENNGDAEKLHLPSNTDANNGNENVLTNPWAINRSGSNTFADRHSYWKPDDVGSIYGGAWPGGLKDRGAVQHDDPSGGSTILINQPVYRL